MDDREMIIPAVGDASLWMRVSNRKRLPLELSNGYGDIGATGLDYWLQALLRNPEIADHVVAVRAVPYSRSSFENASRLCLVALKNRSDDPRNFLRGKIGTEMPELALTRLRALFGGSYRVQDGQIIETEGAVETLLLTGEADAIVEVVDSGKTLNVNRMKVVGDPLIDSTPPVLLLARKVLDVPEASRRVALFASMIHMGLCNAARGELNERLPHPEAISMLEANVAVESVEPVEHYLEQFARKGVTRMEQSDPHWVARKVAVPTREATRIAAELMSRFRGKVDDVMHDRFYYDQDMLVGLDERVPLPELE
ncbi:MAG: hypothetical protein V1876_02900 [Candidatus Peregrinibacteria bacterium]